MEIGHKLPGACDVGGGKKLLARFGARPHLVAGALLRLMLADEGGKTGQAGHAQAAGPIIVIAHILAGHTCSRRPALRRPPANPERYPAASGSPHDRAAMRMRWLELGQVYSPTVMKAVPSSVPSGGRAPGKRSSTRARIPKTRKLKLTATTIVSVHPQRRANHPRGA